MIAGRTANYFRVDIGTITKILRKHNVKWLNRQEANDVLTLETKGYIYQVDKNGIIICKSSTISKALNNLLQNDETIKKVCYESICKAVEGAERKNKSRIHFYKGYYWYSDKNIPKEILDKNK